MLPGGMQLTSVTGYDTYDRVIDIDLDFSPETLFQILTDDEGWQVTQDLRLEGQLGDESQLRWDIGGWFLREQLDVVVTNDPGQTARRARGRAARLHPGPLERGGLREPGLRLLGRLHPRRRLPLQLGAEEARLRAR